MAISGMASETINIRWIRTCTQPCKAAYYRQFSINIRIKIIKLIAVLLDRAFGPFRLTKMV